MDMFKDFISLGEYTASVIVELPGMFWVFRLSNPTCSISFADLLKMELRF